jgi:hypothetical protein
VHSCVLRVGLCHGSCWLKEVFLYATTGITLTFLETLATSTFPKDVHQIQLWKDACKIDEVQNIEHWKICEDHFEANSFVIERKDGVNTSCVPKPHEHHANEDFVLLEELPFSEENVKSV